MKHKPHAPITFITGTDTGVGKTLLTGLLLTYLRKTGVDTLALKPFSSGDRADAILLSQLQEQELALELLNPWHFEEPLAPLLAARLHHERVGLKETIAHLVEMADCCERLLVEGAGGLLTPLGEGFCAVDLIRACRCDVLIVAQNRLGVINHILLTLRALAGQNAQRRGPAAKVVLMNCRAPDFSSATNAAALAELIAPAALISIPYLGANACRQLSLRRRVAGLKHLLARVSAAAEPSSPLDAA